MILPLFRLADALRGRRRRQTDTAETTGRNGEDIAHRFLQRCGLIVVARNWRPRSSAGEIDLVAWEGGTLVFVEVKTRGTDEFGTPDRAVGRDKEEHLRRAAREYARRASVEPERTRFDIVSVTLAAPPVVHWIKDAFRWNQTI